jgi:hypothetical protein
MAKINQKTGVNSIIIGEEKPFMVDASLGKDEILEVKNKNEKSILNSISSITERQEWLSQSARSSNCFIHCDSNYQLDSATILRKRNTGVYVLLPSRLGRCRMLWILD